jgi:hypothetical protein
VLNRSLPSATSGEEPEAAVEIGRAALRSALDGVRADTVYAVVDESLVWNVVADVRTVEPKATVLLDEPTLGRWDEELDEQRTQAEGRGVVWGPTLTAVTGFDIRAQDDVSTDEGAPSTTRAPDEGLVAGEPGGRFHAQAKDAADRILAVIINDEGGSTTQALRASIVADLARIAPGSFGPYRFLPSGVASRRLMGLYARGAAGWEPDQALLATGTCVSAATCRVRPVVSDGA